MLLLAAIVPAHADTISMAFGEKIPPYLFSENGFRP